MAVSTVGAVMIATDENLRGSKGCIAARKLCRTVVCPEPRNDRTPKGPKTNTPL